jgi:hypothetical protein
VHPALDIDLAGGEIKVVSVHGRTGQGRTLLFFVGSAGDQTADFSEKGTEIAWERIEAINRRMSAKNRWFSASCKRQ